MSQFPSPHSPPPDDEGAAPAPRRLIPPQERFAEPAPAPAAEASEPAAETEPEPENPFESQISARRRDEMERRHLPPRERARQERARPKRDVGFPGPDRRRAAPPDGGHHDGGRPADAASPRVQAGRDFARSARESAPPSPAKSRRAPRWLKLRWLKLRWLKLRWLKLRWLKRILALIALLLLGQLGYSALTSPQFGVGAVEIQGVGATPPDQLRHVARDLIGQNIVRLDASGAERAAALLPTVLSAKVVRLAQWPPKVALQISEREPVLKVGAGRDWWVVDRGGVPFRRPGRADEALYCVVAPQFAPLVRRPLEARIWKRALALETALEADNRLASRLANREKSGESERFWQLRRVYFDKDGLASLRLSRAPHREMLVRLGDDAWPAKLVRARQSLAYFERTGRRAAELDLVSLERPVWTPIAPQRMVQSGENLALEAG